MVVSDVEDCPLPNNETALFQNKERQLVSFLYKTGRTVSKEAIWNYLYAHLPESDWPDSDIIKVWISKARKKLRNHDIVCVRGLGYALKPRVISSPHNGELGCAD